MRILPFGKNDILLGADGALSFLEDMTISGRYYLRGELPAPVNLIYVDIDTQAILEFGTFPWNRRLYAETLDALFTYGQVKAVGMDLVLSDPGQPNLGRGGEAQQGNLALGKSIHSHQNVVLGATYISKAGILGKNSSFPLLFERRYDPENTDYPEKPETPLVGPTWGHIGLFDTIGRNDNFLPLFAKNNYTTYLTLSLQLALLNWGLDQSALTIEKNEILVRDPKGALVTRIPLMFRQMAEINWFLPWNSPNNLHTSLYNVLEAAAAMESGTPEQKQGATEFFADFKDAVILIGPTDPLLHDVSTTLIDWSEAVPRVSFHGNMLKTILSGRFIKRPPIWANTLLIFALGLGAASLSIRHRRWVTWQKVVAAVAILTYLPISYLAFRWFDLILPVIAPMGAALSCSFLAVLWQLGVEQGQRRRLKSLFGSYVSPQIVSEMVEHNINPQVGGSETEITALFSDIEAFSPMAEALTPNDLIELMSQYLTECTHAIIENNGTLDKYVGDAIIAIYGAPLPCDTHAAAACHSALGMQEAQKTLGKRWAGEGTRWPVLAHNMRTRVGLNTGLAVVGNLGSHLRFNYTMMGDNVNLAQRMEAAAGVFGVKILTSATTMEEASVQDARLVFRKIDCILVPGRSKPVDAHELVGYRDLITPTELECYEIYNEALEKYLKRDWAGASAGFRISATKEPRAAYRNPSVVMHKRCEAFIEKPPADDWNFAFQLTKGG